MHAKFRQLYNYVCTVIICQTLITLILEYEYVYMQ